MLKWYYEKRLHIRYVKRILRVWLCRLLLRCCIRIFSVEKRFIAPLKDTRKRILIIVFGGLGDCLLFDPLFRRLKEQWPEAIIDVLTGCFEDMWELMESVDNIMYYRPISLRLFWHHTLFFRFIYRMSYNIVAEGLSMLPNHGIYPIFTSLIMEASCAPIRIGRPKTGRQAPIRPKHSGFIGREEMSKNLHKMKTWSNKMKHPFLTHVIDLKPPDKRQDHESSHIFTPLGVKYYRKNNEPSLLPNPYYDQWARNLLRKQLALEQDFIIGLNVETTYPIKEWPIDNFIQVIKWGIRNRFKFVVLGLRPRISTKLYKLFPEDDLLNLSGETSLGKMIAIIRECNFFLAGDTGAAHVAQACQTPSIVLFGPSNEREFGPFELALHTMILPPGNLRCRPCVLGPCIKDKTCMHLITPEMVYKELIQKIRKLQSKRDDLKKVKLDNVSKSGKYPRVIYTL